jgi:hypothetical protein
MPNIGKPRGPYCRKSALERFCRKVHIPQDDSQCWEWQGARNHHGHGMFAPQGHIPRCTHAHRWLYQYVHGVILPSNITINHRCDHPPCVNPQHLYAGTHQDNMRDMVARGRQTRGTAHPQARFTEEQVRAVRASRLSCVALARQYSVNLQTISNIKNGKTWKHL